MLDTLIEITAFPNPFREGTTLSVQLHQNMPTDYLAFTIYDINGRVVKSFPTTVTARNQRFQFYWDGTDTRQQRLGSGMYFFTVQTEVGIRHLKLVLIQ